MSDRDARGRCSAAIDRPPGPPSAPGGRPPAAAAAHGAALKLGVTRFGPRVLADGTLFRLWAPDRDAVAVEVDGVTVPMRREPDGWFEVLVPGIGAGARYRFRADALTFPDPASRAQDGDVADASIVTRPPADRRNRRLGRPWTETVMVEVHVGTATPEGTFRALCDRLPHYAAAGFTAIALMPIADFPGRHGWGYDGVLPFAPERSYGTPDDLARLVARAHELELSVVLDVVYNHFGPIGNALPDYAGAFFDPATRTPWGPAIDLTRAPVRRFFIENALYWLDTFGIDGLRFDAVHAFQPAGRDLFLTELAETLNALRPRPFLILENEHNEAGRLDATGADPAAFAAQWNDDFHHVFHVAVTGESEGYYAAYADDPLGRMARVLAEGFDYQGHPIVLRGGAPRGEPSGHLHPAAFVAFAQNHDQIGNRAFGERLTALAAPEAVRLILFATLLSPQIPMLFMGEEFESRQPFRFFCDFEGEMAEAVRSGRRAEFAAFAAFAGEELPDPVAPETFLASKLDWQRLASEEGRAALARFRDLVDLRRRLVVPLLAGAYRGGQARASGRLVSAAWRFDGGGYGLALNLSDRPRFARLAAQSPAGTIGTVAPGPGHWLFEPYSGVIWIEP